MGKLRLIISGAPASGKGTLCSRIVSKYNVVHISTGDLLRAAVAAGTPLGLEAKTYMEGGKLVPDALVIGLVKERMAQPDVRERGWMLDGFPRTPAQAEAMKAAGIEPQKVVLLDCPEEVLIQRVCGRRTDPVTGAIYHLQFSPPPADAAIVARLVQRSDDTEEKCRVRLTQYRANAQPLFDFYRDRIVAVNSNQKPDSVFVEADKVLSTL